MAQGPTGASTALAARPRISVAIPYFSNASYLMEAVASVQTQTVADWELIVVDDHGPEPAEHLVTALADPRISYVRNPTNLGLAENWNLCLRIATAPWVTLLHADDRLRPAYAEAVLAVAQRDSSIAAIFTDAVIIGADGDRTRSLPDSVKRLAPRPRHDHDVGGDAGLASILANNYVMCPTMAYRAAALDERRFDPRWKMVMDLDHTARMLLRGERLHGIRRPLYEYRRHAGNQTTSLTASAHRFEEELALYRELAAATAGAAWPQSNRAARHRSMVRTHLGVQAIFDVTRGRRTAARRKVALLARDLRRGSRSDRL